MPFIINLFDFPFAAASLPPCGHLNPFAIFDEQMRKAKNERKKDARIRSICKRHSYFLFNDVKCNRYVLYSKQISMLNLCNVYFKQFYAILQSNVCVCTLNKVF